MWKILHWLLIIQTGVNSEPSNHATNSNHFTFKDNNNQAEFIHELMLHNGEEKNYVLIGEEFNVPCSIVSCERYNRRDLRKVLERRGELFDKADDNYVYLQDLNSERKYKSGSREKDVFFVSLSLFTPEEKDLLKLIRKFSMKSYIVIIVETSKMFENYKRYLISKELFNTYLAVVSSDKDVYLLYELCGYCDKGKHQVKFSNSWKFKRGFLNSRKFQSSFKGSFNGANIKIGVKLGVPFIFPMGKSPKGEIIYGGTEFWLLQTLASSLDFNLVLTESVNKTTCMLRSKNRFEVVGFCKMLLKNEVQMAGFPIAFPYNLNLYLEKTAVYYTDHVYLISASPTFQKKWNTMLPVIEPYILLLILVSYILVSIIIWLTHISLQDDAEGFYDVLFRAFAILCFESVRFRELRVSKQLILGVWMISCTIVISLVISEITSVIAKPSISGNVINTVQDMKKHDVSWVTVPQYHVDVELQRHLPKQYPKRKKLPLQEGLQFVLDNPEDYVFAYVKIGADPAIRKFFWNGYGQNPFYFSPPIKEDRAIPLEVVVRKDAPFGKAIRIKLLEIVAADLYEGRFMKDTNELFRRSSDMANDYKEKIPEIKFSMENLTPVLILWTFLVLFSLVEFSLEYTCPNGIIYKICSNRKYSNVRNEIEKH